MGSAARGSAGKPARGPHTSASDSDAIITAPSPVMRVPSARPLGSRRHVHHAAVARAGMTKQRSMRKIDQSSVGCRPGPSRWLVPVA